MALAATWQTLKIGVTRRLLAKFHQIPSFEEFPINFP
jgi:hypothetical protein